MHTLRFAFVASLIVVVGCGDNSSSTPDAPSGPQCSDGVDNDSDGMIDFPADLGCDDANDESEDSAADPQCSDNRDNDGDGKIDFPNDPGCPAPNVDDENDPCPEGPGCPQCGDGQDNDQNGMTDFPDDPGCSSAFDGLEFTDDPNACGQGMVIKPLPITNTDMGTLTGSTSMVSSPCGGGNGLPAVAYVIHLTTPKVLIASTDDPMTMIDTVLDLRAAMCSVPGAEIACHDDILPTGTTPNRKSTITESLLPGTYYLVISGKTAADTGQYALKVDFLAGEGSSCGATSDCGPGLVCRVPVNQTQMVCSKPVCDDGRDDDADGIPDYPNDPGCTSPTDDTEDDTCNTTPPGPSCPECSNTVDDDGDGNIDYGADPNCHSAGGSSEACAQSEDVQEITAPIMMGTTVGAVNDLKPSCGAPTHNAPDVVYRLEVPAMATLGLNVSGFDTAHSLLDGTCGTPAIACSDPALMSRTNVAAGVYYVVVDGWSTGTGSFTLTTSGTVAPGESCEGALFQAGAFTCTAGYACGGTPGARTCVVVACNDSMDNDGDGKTDFPADPGCTSASGNDETDDCFPTPGPNCPQCSDGMDNDNDGNTDFPADPSCVTAASGDEVCGQSETIAVVTTAQTMGTTVGAVNDYRPPAGSINGHLCSTTLTHSAPDVTYALDLPQLDALSITMSPVSYDSTHVLLNSTCGGTVIDCSDSPSGMNNLTNISAGRYYVMVDGYSSGSGTFTMNVSGKISGGASCAGPLAQSGALQCAAGFMCGGTPGSETCLPLPCTDGVDNDGDGKIDADDPGCTTFADTDETDDCSPTVGPNCPECSDMVDNDGDGQIDYPTDPSCFRASESSESCAKSEAMLYATTQMTMGTTVGAVNDYRPPPGNFNGHLCSTTSTTTATAPDVTVTLDLPAMQTISLALSPSPSWDSAHVLLDSTCGGTPIECSDSPTGMNLTNLAEGIYYLMVDGYSSGSGPFTLNVTGTIAPGGSCEVPLAQSGAIMCPTNYACGGTIGSRRCLGQFQCSDGMDNDGDGKTDYPAEPGCASPTDIDETDDCFPTVGPNCPQCGNGIDDDLDMNPDFPADSDCPNASFFHEAFCSADTDIGGVIAAPSTNGTFVGTVGDFHQSCQTSTGGDVTYLLSLPVPVAQLQIDTIGSAGDTVLSLWNSTCSSQIECDDDDGGMLKSLIVRTNVAAGDYAIELDSYTGAVNNTTYVLNVRGTVAAGTACTDPLFAAGVLRCPSSTTCTAGVCQ